jgi:hypothetical protein
MRCVSEFLFRDARSINYHALQLHHAYNGGQGESLMPPYTRGSVSFSIIMLSRGTAFVNLRGVYV